jgi:hypothetical protein
MLVMTYGAREAARQLGLSENTVLAWSARGEWLADMPNPHQPYRPKVQSVVINEPVNALAQSMKADSLGGRAAALRVTRRALERADKYQDDELMVPDVAQVIHSYVKSAAVAGGYSSADAVVKMNLSITSQPQTMEAQITELPNAEELP